jgi:hypothetical protein
LKNAPKSLKLRPKRIPKTQASHLLPTVPTKRKRRKPKAASVKKEHKKDTNENTLYPLNMYKFIIIYG